LRLATTVIIANMGSVVGAEQIVSRIASLIRVSGPWVPAWPPPARRRGTAMIASLAFGDGKSKWAAREGRPFTFNNCKRY